VARLISIVNVAEVVPRPSAGSDEVAHTKRDIGDCTPVAFRDRRDGYFFRSLSSTATAAGGGLGQGCLDTWLK
jgi:hypothetical protein